MSEYVLTDAALRQAAAQVRDAMLSAQPSPSACEHEFSPAFEEKMARLTVRVRRRERRRRLTRQVAAVFLALLLGSGAWLALDTEARAGFVSWVREIYEDSVIYRSYISHDELSEPLPLYEIGWLPEGYEKTKEDYNDTMYSAVYKNPEDVKNGLKTSFVFNYSYMFDGGYTKLAADEDSYLIETLTINGMTAHFYQALDPSDTNNLIWIDEENSILFELNSHLEKTVIFAIAESVKLAK